MEKTIRSQRGFERVCLDPAEVSSVQTSVIAFNTAVVGECMERVDEEFAHVEPERRLQIALLLADKACVSSYTAQIAALDAKVADLRDAARRSGGEATR